MVAPLILVMLPPVALRFPHWRAVIVPPPVSAALSCVPDAEAQIVCASDGVTATSVRPVLTDNVANPSVVASGEQVPETIHWYL